jgi:signal transduction histidine kinase
LGQLARAFDDMAHALDTRQVEALRAEEALQRAVERLELLQQIDRAMLTAQSSQAIAQAALDHICTLVSCWRAGISMFDFEAQEGVIFANAGHGSSPFAPGTRMRLASYGAQDLAALQAEQIYVVEDILTLSAPPAIAHQMLTEGVRAYARVPLLWQGQLIGALNLWMDSPGSLTSESLAIARDVADVLAVAIQQACLHEQVQRQATELEARVAARTAELSAANRELETFSYSVSHDLRAPLRAIEGFSQALLEEYANILDADGQDYLQRIRGATARMAELIEALLGLARVTRAGLSPEPVDVTAMAHMIATDPRRSEPARLVEVLIADGLVIHGDRRLLRVMLDNLLGNAWKFTAKQPQARIELGRLLSPDGPSAFFVRDNGAGFDMAYADKHFGASQRLHRMSEFHGTGLGLATVQRIIHRHGGRIWAEGALGRGATFCFTL